MNFNKKDRKLANKLSNYLEIPFLNEKLKIHNKGMGLICVKYQTLIIENFILIHGNYEIKNSLNFN